MFYLKFIIRARSILGCALWTLSLSMFLYFNYNFFGGSFFLYFSKTCLSISSGGWHKRLYRFCSSVATAFLQTGVRTFARQMVMFLYFNCNFVGGSFFLYFWKTCLSISSGSWHKRLYHFCSSVATTFLQTGVRTLVRHMPTTTHLLPSDILLVLAMLAISYL